MASRKLLLTLTFALSAGAGACGDDGASGPTCGMGTMLVDGMCVATGSAGPTCGSGTMLVNGACVSDSSCGPGTVLQAGQCVVDATSPDPVTGLTATASGSGIALSWTAGANSTGTLVARLVAGSYDTPISLGAYNAGQTLPGGATVLADGAGTSVTDAVTAPGRYSYLVWSRNASGKFGFPREVSAMIAVPTQTASVVVDITAGTATVASQPANIALETANFAFDSASGTVTFDLSATQNTAGHLFNVKAVFGTPSVGAITNQSGNTAAGDPYVTFSVGAIPPATKLTQTISINNVTATDTVTLPITIIESGLAIVGPNAVDMAGGNAFQMQLPAIRGRGNSDSAFSGGLFGASGRYFYGTARWSPGVFRVDTATGDVSVVMPLAIATGSGVCLVQAADGYDYEVIGLNAHRRGKASGLALAKLDPVTLTTIATTTLPITTTAVTHGCALHGSTLAIGFDQNVYFANIGTMTFTDTDPTTADVVDPVAVTATAPVQLLAFSPDGATVYASEQRTALIYSVDTTAFTSATYHTAPGIVYGLTVDAAGTLWWGQSNGLYSFDGTTETPVPNFTTAVYAIGPRIGNVVSVASSSGSSFALDVTDGTMTLQGTLGTTSRMGHKYYAFPTP